MKRSALSKCPARGHTIRTILITCVALTASAAVADARVLCSSKLGHLRLREACRATETRVEMGEVLGGQIPPPPDLTAVSIATDTTRVGLSPCRLVDTRPGTSSAVTGDDVGTFAPRELRTYALRGLCQIPAAAKAVSINVAVVPGGTNGFASIGPSGAVTTSPSFASINYRGGGSAISNAMVVDLDAQGAIDVFAASNANFIIDVNGYFVPKDAGTREIFLAAGPDDSVNGDALSATVAELRARADQETVVLRLGPGRFWLAEGIVLDRNISLVGAGRNLTSVHCSCAGATVRVASYSAEIRDIFILSQSFSPSDYAIYIEPTASAAVLSDVRVSSSGTGVHVRAPQVELDRVRIVAGAYGVFTGATDISIKDSRIWASQHAIIGNGAVTIEDSTLEGQTATVYLPGGNAKISHSRLVTNGEPYAIGSTASLTLAHSTIEGTGINSLLGVSTCVATVKGSGFHATGCP